MTEQAQFDEQVIEFSDKGNLVGVLTTPTQNKASGPTLIIINSGALHRVGACRSAVIIARAMAQSGFSTFRFDLHGIGDSGFGGSHSEDQMRGKPEITEAMNMLDTRNGSSEYVLHGLCSGARDAFSAAIGDKRVVGISMIDGHAYRNIRFYLNKVPAFLLNPSKWLNFILVRLPKSGKEDTEQDNDEVMEYQVWPDYPKKSVVQEGFSTLVARDVKMLVTYTGDWKDEYNYEGQFNDMYSRVNFGKQQLILNYMPNANHVMTDPNDRAIIINRLEELLST